MNHSEVLKDRLLDFCSMSRFFISLLFILTFPVSGQAATPPSIAIIMDDLGDTLSTGYQAIDLPYEITYSFLPRSRHTFTLATYASDQDKEIMLHMPMEPKGKESMGHGGLEVDMERRQFLQVLRQNMMSVPNFVGINNHMGSRLTSHPQSMAWFMSELSAYEDLYFVDSFTTLASVAYTTAVKNHVPAITRDVFLDHDKDFRRLEFYFDKLIKVAKRRGYALAIAHPHPQTIKFLARSLATLEHRGIKLLPVSQLIELKKRREILWRASLSPSPKAVKN